MHFIHINRSIRMTYYVSGKVYDISQPKNIFLDFISLDTESNSNDALRRSTLDET